MNLCQSYKYMLLFSSLLFEFFFYFTLLVFFLVDSLCLFLLFKKVFVLFKGTVCNNLHVFAVF